MYKDEALNQALEQPAPVQEPVALKILAAFPLFDEKGLDEEKHHCEWVLHQDRKRLHAMLTNPPAPQPEPVAWRVLDKDPLGSTDDRWAYFDKSEFQNGVDPAKLGIEPLYTTPFAQREFVGLTDEEREDIWDSHSFSVRPSGVNFANRIYLIQAIEAKLKEKNNGHH